MKSSIKTYISPYGACVKVAAFFGFRSVQGLFTNLGIAHVRVWNSITEADAQEVLKDPAVAAKTAGFEWMTTCVVSEFDKKYASQTIKICPACIMEGQPHKIVWQDVEQTICEKHLVPLQNICKQRLFDLESGIHSDCSNCSECTECNTAESLLPFEIALLDIAGGSQRRYFLNVLFTIAERLIRPLDFITSPLNWAKGSVFMVRQLINDAYILSLDECARVTWLKMIAEHRQQFSILGDSVQEINCHSLNIVLSKISWQPKTEFAGQTENLIKKYHVKAESHPMVTAKTRYDNATSGDELSLQITGNDVANIFGVSPAHVTKLLNLGTLIAVHSGQQPDKQIFDMMTILETFQNTYPTVSALEHDYINITEIPSAIFDLYCLDIDELIKSAFDKKIESQLRVNSTVRYTNQLQIAPAGLKKLLKQKWQSLCDQPILKVIAMLRCNDKVIGDLIELGFIKTSDTNKALIDINSLKTFVENYLIINRKATFSHARSYANNVRECCGNDPVYSRFMDPNRTDFVVFDKGLLNNCCVEQLPKRFQHFLKTGVELSKTVRAHS
ncbi:hypothetical protein [Brumicola pallidula]|uniref:TniQ protein n=1 Tax=Brumicola pallidula DSM 14239 = ACAM 615 TaxID=1121922 RepID=K6ZX15_9ALTE|nr:hypothetical protein [Glaciecola pallidula]GAC27860.1 hypothetical protein GPAL_0981 [Glaciecola pallidula DSM 14239 = ACAM 615]